KHLYRFETPEAAGATLLTLDRKPRIHTNRSSSVSPASHTSRTEAGYSLSHRRPLQGRKAGPRPRLPHPTANEHHDRPQSGRTRGCTSGTPPTVANARL